MTRGPGRVRPYPSGADGCVSVPSDGLSKGRGLLQRYSRGVPARIDQYRSKLRAIFQAEGLQNIALSSYESICIIGRKGDMGYHFVGDAQNILSFPMQRDQVQRLFPSLQLSQESIFIDTERPSIRQRIPGKDIL